MNLAHCIHGLGLGGAQKVIATIVHGRRNTALNYFVYSCNDGVHREEIEQAGATVRIIPRSIAKFDPLWIRRLARAMRRDRIDLVHTHLFGDSLHGYLGARQAGDLSVVMTLHTRPEGLTALQRRGYRWLLARCGAAVACSAAVHRAFSDQGFSAQRFTTIANGLEPAGHDLTAAERQELRASFGISADTILIAAVGRMAPEKDYSSLIAALARISSERDIRLLLVGDGPLRDRLEAETRDLGLSDRVIFTGIRSDVPSLLQAVDIVAFSSLWEGLSMVLLEAMAAGRSIVTTVVHGLLEAVRDDREAMVVPAGDASALASALNRAASDPALRERLGTAARQRFEAHFTADVMVQAYEALYLDVLGHGSW